MSELQEELDALTGGRTRSYPVEREVEHFSHWLVDLFDAAPLPDAAVELAFELRTPTWGGRIDSCEVDVSARTESDEPCWPPRVASTTSAILSRLAPELEPEPLELAAAHLLAAALERLDASTILGERSALHARVGETGWWLDAGA